MARSDAAPLIALSHRISQDPTCAARARDIGLLRDRTLALVNAHRIPATLAESLVSGVNALVAETPVCLPTVATTAPAPAPRAPRPHDHHEKHGHGHGKHGGEGD